MTVEPLRFEHGRAMLLGGIRQHHTFDGAAETIPEQWRRFHQLGPLPDRLGTVLYGVMCSGDPENKRFEYMCGAEVADLTVLPSNLGRMRIPEANYAVFIHNGHVSTLKDTWDYIWYSWMPVSGYLAANSPDFEVYDDRFDASTGLGGIEIWFPVIESLSSV